MILEEKPLHTLVAEDILNMIGTVSESNVLDYKSQLPETPAARKEYLCDVSAFANTVGGYLVFGVDEQGGVAIGVSGLKVEDKDDLILLLENIVRDGLEPRVVVHTYCISNVDGADVVVVHIPQSVVMPHMVTFQGHGRFYLRDSRSKHPMNVDELRRAFRALETADQSTSTFRDEQVGRISRGVAPLQMTEGPKVAMHIFPFAIRNDHCDFERLNAQPTLLRPLFISDGWNNKYTANSRVTFRGTEPTISYLQVFRNGVIESVSSGFFVPGEKKIGSVVFERELIHGLEQYMILQQVIGIEGPFRIALSLIGVQGYSMAVDMQTAIIHGLPQIMRGDDLSIPDGNLLIPEITVTDRKSSPHTILKPVLDQVWNACGWAKSPYYDRSGLWNPDGR